MDKTVATSFHLLGDSQSITTKDQDRGAIDHRIREPVEGPEALGPVCRLEANNVPSI